MMDIHGGVLFLFCYVEVHILSVFFNHHMTVLDLAQQSFQIFHAVEDGFGGQCFDNASM